MVVSRHVNDDHDDDIGNLIGGSKNLATQAAEMKPLNLEVVQGNESTKMKNIVIAKGKRITQESSIVALCCAHINYACDYTPRLCWSLGFLALLVSTYFLIVGILFNPNEHFGVANDYTDIKSQYDMTIGNIDHWCLKGDNESCRCEDPLHPQPRLEYKSWAETWHANKETITTLIQNGKATPDIAFLGASIVEEMDGKWFGNSLDTGLSNLGQLFAKNFHTSEGAALEGVALGIAGDTSPSVLWRLLNGEMPAAFNPKIWWLELGLNDLGRMQCSEEVVVLGVLRVVEEILAQKQDAKIVINSLFPLADLRGGIQAQKRDYLDSFDKSLRAKPTLAMEKRGGKLRNHGKIVQTTAETNESNFVAPDKTAKNKRINKLKNNGGGASRDLIMGAPKQMRKQSTRRLAWFGGRSYNSRTGKIKKVSMKSEKNSQRQYNIVTHRERKLPLWTSVSAINAELAKFASKNDRVYFFDATKIFTEREASADTYTLKTDMISIRGHPTRAGFEKWEESIKVYAQTLLKV